MAIDDRVISDERQRIDFALPGDDGGEDAGDDEDDDGAASIVVAPGAVLRAGRRRFVRLVPTGGPS